MKIDILESVTGDIAVFSKDNDFCSVTLKCYAPNQWYVDKMIGSWEIDDDHGLTFSDGKLILTTAKVK